LVKGQTQAERETGIPKETIHGWMERPEFAQLRTRAREDVAEDFWTAVQIALREVTRGVQDPDQPVRDKAQALGIMYDRFALLTGSATARTEARDITGTITDAELAATVRAGVDVLTGASRAEAPPPGTPEGEGVPALSE
jgi:hypothetical protein